jgi:DNA (cytosine-5)-methyltransferase 1
MSNNCNCGEDNFRLEDVEATISVKWLPKVITAHDYFVRQKYCTEEHSFTTLKESDFGCDCHLPVSPSFALVERQYQMGDTILGVQGQWLEPFVVTDFVQEIGKVKVRRLLRAKVNGKLHSRANELIWTDEFRELSPSSIRRKCSIRFFTPENAAILPVPYDRDGQGDCYFITSRLLRRNSQDILQSLRHPFPGPMNEGFDPNISIDRPPLSSLSLFSGGGNFDRGLEEGGAINTNWVVEWDTNAVHTFLANLKNPEKTQIFHGSVDDALAQAINGHDSKFVPRIGEVQHIAAGSPCQAFSTMQQNSMSERSKTNASKIASVAAFIDFYRPAYALLENVPSMTYKQGLNKDENIFSQ